MYWVFLNLFSYWAPFFCFYYEVESWFQFSWTDDIEFILIDVFCIVNLNTWEIVLQGPTPIIISN